MRRLAFVGLVALGVATAGAQTARHNYTELRVAGMDPTHDSYVIEVVDQGTPVILAEIPVDDEGMGAVVFEGRLDYPRVTIRPAPTP